MNLAVSHDEPSSALDAASLRTTVIRPTSGWAALNLPEVWQYRDLLLTLAMRDVKLRYRQTALGVIWVILQPLIAAAIFSFVSKIGHFSTDGVSPFMFTYAGMLGWNAFASTLTKSSMCLVGNSQLVSKIYFPRLVLPLSTVFSTLIDFGVGLSVMIVLMPLNHASPSLLALVTLPFWLLMLVFLAMGIGLFAAALTVTYRDIQYILPVFTQFFLFASPVFYSATSIHSHNLQFAYYLNPISGLLQGFRWSLLGAGSVSPIAVLYSVVFVAAAFILGVVGFRNMERGFADVI
ncbi:MAG: ABC transporter permease [Capsulimonadaceae bacterium]|nr:ABC transporter permease [Capsulimonadaceae bacterium]